MDAFWSGASLFKCEVSFQIAIRAGRTQNENLWRSHVMVTLNPRNKPNVILEKAGVIKNIMQER
jgi:hypothetical protein